MRVRRHEVTFEVMTGAQQDVPRAAARKLAEFGVEPEAVLELSLTSSPYIVGGDGVVSLWQTEVRATLVGPRPDGSSGQSEG